MSNIFFVGAGGIGMANLVRYYLAQGAAVAGYDLTPSALTKALEEEGATLVYEDDENLIPPAFRNPEETLVVYTPAVPESNRILSWFRTGGFEVIKRAALLGKITRQSRGICVAGSHGKTTTSSMIAHILHDSKQGCNAFLGGILRNTGSNLMLSQGSPWSVIEADEYDRSFHHLRPFMAVITSTDPDHLDIYGDEEHYLEAFTHFTELIVPGGYLVLHKGLKMRPNTGKDVTTFTYSATQDGNYHAENVRYGEGRLFFDLVTPDSRISDIELGVPVEINIDNAVAAAACALLAGANNADVREGLRTFKGAKRRFEVWLDGSENTDGKVLIDDYAHSPAEIEASIKSVRKLYPDKKICAVFQPHLYTRTRDFATEFGNALSAADSVVLLEIYPARELPIEGVTSQIILDRVENDNKCLISRKNLVEKIKNSNFDILMTLGAADIDRVLPDLKQALLSREA